MTNLLDPTQFKKHWRMYVAGGVTALIATIFLINTVPLITGEIGTLFVPRHIPEDYLKLKDFILAQNEYFRTFWTPRDSRWGIYTNLHPKVSNVSIIGGDWKDFVDETKYPRPIQARDKIISVLKLPFANALLESGAIKYIVVPIEDRANDDNFYVHYGMGRAYYVNEMNKLSYLKKVDVGTEELTVYENEEYAPYIRAMDGVREFATKDNLDGKYAFVTNALGKEFDFAIGGEESATAGIPFERIYDFADDLSEKNIDTQGLRFEMPAMEGKTTLYADAGAKHVRFTAGKDEIVVTAQAEENLFLGDSPLVSTSSTTSEDLLRVARVPNRDYYLRIGDALIPLPPEGAHGTLGAYPHAVEVVAVMQANLIENPTFDGGLWRDKVGDCNNYDDNGMIDIHLLEGSNVSILERSNVLELSAGRHIACTGPDRVAVEAGREYLLSFDYQSPNAPQAGYHVSFPGTDLTFAERLPLTDQEWHTFHRVITTPEDAQTMALTVYSYSRDDGEAMRTRYDHFALRPVTESGQNSLFWPQEQPQYAKAAILNPDSGPLSFSYHEDGFMPRNLIPNPSFEEGLWQDKVGDCNNYDDQPALAMDWKKGDASEGAFALALGARRHIACTGPGIIKVSGGKDYLFAFDYESANSKQAGYYIGFNNASSTSVSERLPIKEKGWQEFRKIVTIPEGATTASLVVYSYSQDGKKEIVTRYDDFHFYELPALRNRYYLVSAPEAELRKPESVEFTLINPTKKRVRVVGATMPFFLAMSESYHDQWRLMLDNDAVNGFFGSWIPWIPFADRVGDWAHFKLNGFLNGWYIDPAGLCTKSDTPLVAGCTRHADGSYDIDMVIEFFPQRYFYLGLLISGLTLAGCLGYLVYDRRTRRKTS